MKLIDAINVVRTGESVKLRPHGNSMTPKIKSGDLVTIEPIKSDGVNVGDIVLCKVNGNAMLHLVTAKRGKQFQISNNHGRVNGWTTQIYGIVTEVI